jgi:3-oxoacyl-[acyl-carrier-protein] synthase III
MPITLDETYRQGKIQPGDHVMFVGFGAGFALAASVFSWVKPAPKQQA